VNSGYVSEAESRKSSRTLRGARSIDFGPSL